MNEKEINKIYGTFFNTGIYDARDEMQNRLDKLTPKYRAVVKMFPSDVDENKPHWIIGSVRVRHSDPSYDIYAIQIS